jgi:RHS repeat-associated protein
MKAGMRLSIYDLQTRWKYVLSLLSESSYLVLGRRIINVLVLAATCTWVLVSPLAAQSYESAFSPQAVGKGSGLVYKNPAVSVEQATGFVRFELPLGPAMGVPRGGLSFVPSMRLHVAPKTDLVFIDATFSAGGVRPGAPDLALTEDNNAHYSCVSTPIWKNGTLAGWACGGSVYLFSDQPIAGGAESPSTSALSTATYALFTESPLFSPVYKQGAFFNPASVDQGRTATYRPLQKTFQDANGTQSTKFFSAEGRGASLKSLDPGRALWNRFGNSLTLSLPNGQSVARLAHTVGKDAEFDPDPASAISYRALVNQFGYTGTPFSSLPTFPASRTTSGDMLFSLQHQDGGVWKDIEVLDHPGYPTMTQTVKVPAVLLLVQGDLAYEFSYVGVRYKLNGGSSGKLTQVQSAGYVVTAIRNRFGDAVVFTHNNADMMSYTAKLQVARQDTKRSVSVTFKRGIATTAFNLDGLKGDYAPDGMSAEIVQYDDTTELSHFVLNGAYATPEAYDAMYGGSGYPGYYDPSSNMFHHYFEARIRFQPTSIQETKSQFKVDLTYKQESYSYPISGQQVYNAEYDTLATVAVLDAVQFSNGERFEFDYQAQPYFHGEMDPAYGNQIVSTMAMKPASFGVKEMRHKDTVDGAVRRTTYERVYPDFMDETGTIGWNRPIHWNSFAFWEAETQWDGSTAKGTVVRRFVPPVQDSTGAPELGDAGRLQTYLFIKNTLAEQRWYTSSDIAKSEAASPTASNAYKIAHYSLWDLRTFGNPYGKVEYGSSPVATRTVEWSALDQVAKVTQIQGWDAASQNWTQRAEGLFSSSNPFTDFNLAAEAYTPSPLVLNQTSFKRMSDYGAAPLVDRQQVDTFKALDPNFLPGAHLSAETQQAGGQNVPSYVAAAGQPTGAPGGAYQAIAPKNVKSLDDTKGFAKAAWLETSGQVQTRVDYQFGTTEGLPASLSFTSPAGFYAFADRAGVGISFYGYDAMLRMNSVQPKGVSYGMTREFDGASRVKSLTDGNGLQQKYGWDTLGRLSSVTLPGTELGTTITPDPSFRSVTVTKGTQKSLTAFNAFGEVVREVRWDGTTASHRKFGYDALGRKTWESPWLAGEDDSSTWTSPTGPGDVPMVNAWDEWVPLGYDKCVQYGYDGDGNVVCVATAPAMKKVTHPAIPAQWGVLSRYAYDDYSRPVQVISPTGEVTDMSYGVRTKTVSQGRVWVNNVISDPANLALKISTSFVNDPLGRLAKVVDALNQVTEYRYDALDHLVSVTQYSTSTGAGAAAVGTGTPQVRTWEYNAMGWLTALTQPESGRTEYADFTVQGKPRTTRYGVVNGTAAKTLTTTYDEQGRVTKVTSSDNTVNHTLNYDEGGKDSYANGKLTSATAGGGVSRQLKYNGANGLNGRLTDLIRTVDGLVFTQSFTWNTDGSLASRTYPNHTNQTATASAGPLQSLDYYFTQGLPKSTTFNGLTTSMVYDPASWGLTQLNLPNAATSQFWYRADQAQLSKMTHTYAGQTRTWNYSYNELGQLNSDGEDYYSYDKLGRLTLALVRDPFGAANAGQMQQFGYDLVDANGNVTQSSFGNRTSLQSKNITWTSAVGAATASYTINGVSTKAGMLSYAMTPSEVAGMAAANRLPGTVGGPGISTGAGYDALGNLTSLYRVPNQSSTQLLMGYDALGRVTSMSVSDPIASNATSQTYLYDDEGLRIKIVDTKTNKTTYNVYNESRQLIASYEKVGSGALTWKKDIVYVGTKEVAEVDNGGKTWVTFVDHLGSPRLIWDGQVDAQTHLPAKGTNLFEQKFMPFGETLSDPTSAVKFAKGFTNHEQTDASGLIYMQARFYAPWFGRFMSPDPARDQHFELTQSWNIYSYVQNSPTMSIDPTGMVIDGPGGGSQSVGQALDQAGQAAYENGNYASWIGLAFLNATYQTLTPGGDRLSQVNARAQNGEVISNKELAATATIATGSVALIAVGGNAASSGSNVALKTGSEMVMARATQAVIAGDKALAIVMPATAMAMNGGTGPVNKGKSGEAQVKAIEDIGPRENFRGQSGNNRITDGSTSSAVNEVKNVVKQGWTSQLKDSAELASRTDRIFQLWVPKGATLTRPLEAAREAGKVVVRCF